jgi:lichenan operon transcriptional antiterminator
MANQLLAATDERTPATPEKRMRFLIKKLLTGTQETIDLFQLCEDEMFVSMETIKKDLSAARKRFKEFDLYVISSGFEIWLEGLELNKRKMLSNMNLHQDV